MPILYHYTNAAALQSILKEQVLRPSLLANRPRDVRYGDGQYLTDAAPGSLTSVQLSLLLVENPFEAYRFTHYLAVDVSGLTIIRGRPGIFVLRTSENLDLTGRIKRAGQNL